MAEWVRLLLVPVTVIVEVAAGVLALVVTVIVEVPLPVTVAGTKFAEAPVGNPAAVSVTVPELPWLMNTPPPRLAELPLTVQLVSVAVAPWLK